MSTSLSAASATFLQAGQETCGPFDTHLVLNQVPPLADVNLVALNQPLLDALSANGIDPIAEGLLSFGEAWGTAERLDLGRLANENPPKLKTHTPRGERADVVEFHPAYHAMMAASIADGVHASTWDGVNEQSGPHGHVARIARHMVISGVEPGHICPITMTHASLATLAAAPERLREWLPFVRSRHYDPRFIPFWEKRGVTLGMAMTEKQGGTDVRANTTRAVAVQGDEYEITGHKWFVSAPMSDAFLVLAQTQAGPTCFLVPRFRPDGRVNALRLQRLKDKLGNRSNASSEIEFTGAFGWRIGEEGRGVRTIIDMVSCTRLDCVSGSTGLMRMALTLAVHHARHRSVFGHRLVDQPAMREVVADLALEVEAMTALALRLARSFDGAEGDAREQAFARVVTPAAKFHACKAAPAMIYEAMECLGGNGYVEESPLPRLYREAPVNAIWEGSGNVMALDVLRAAARETEATAMTLVTLADETRGLPGAAQAVADIEAALKSERPEARARFATDRLATLATVAALRNTAPVAVTEAYARTRLAGPRLVFGANDLDGATDVLVDRALPLI